LISERRKHEDKVVTIIQSNADRQKVYLLRRLRFLRIVSIPFGFRELMVLVLGLRIAFNIVSIVRLEPIPLGETMVGEHTVDENVGTAINQ
jgi:hypothetical protein